SSPRRALVEGRHHAGRQPWLKVGARCLQIIVVPPVVGPTLAESCPQPAVPLLHSGILPGNALHMQVPPLLEKLVDLMHVDATAYGEATVGPAALEPDYLDQPRLGLTIESETEAAESPLLKQRREDTNRCPQLVSTWHCGNILNR